MRKVKIIIFDLQEKECYNIHSEDETKRDFLTVNSNEERWSDISNYFSNVNNNIFSDIVKKPDFPQNQLGKNFPVSPVSENSPYLLLYFFQKRPLKKIVQQIQMFYQNYH